MPLEEHVLAGVERIAVLGVGLIGGSLALTLRRAGYSGRIAGYSRRTAESERALALGVVDEAAATPAEAVAGADLVVLGVPPGAMPALMAQIAPTCAGQAVVTDVGSVKAAVVAAGEAQFGGRFIGAHPIAGKERHGVAAAEAGLFRHSRCVITPTATSDPRALDLVRALWAAAGCEVLEMPPAVHDEALAVTSHLPHLLAFALMEQFAAHPRSKELSRLTGGGFRDFSRIASSDPALWADIALQNREALLQAVQIYQQTLERFAEQLRQGDQAALAAGFARAKRARDAVLATHSCSKTGSKHDG